MRATIDVPSFRRSFSRVGKITPARSPMDVLKAVLLDVAADGTARLVGTNLECWVEAVETAEVDIPGSVAIPKEYFEGILRTTEDSGLRLDYEGDRLHVRGVSTPSRWAVACEPPDRFVPAPPMPAQASLEVDAAGLARCLKRTIGVTSDATLQGYMLGGLLFEWGAVDAEGELAVVACDGRRMARQSAAATVLGHLPPNPHSPTVGGDFAKLLAGLVEPDAGTVTVAFNLAGDGGEATTAWFRFANLTVCGRLLVGKFPPYRSMKYQASHSYTLGTAALRRAIDQVAIGVTESTRRIDLAFSEAGLTVSLPETGVAAATASMAATHAGDPVSSSYDHRYLSEPLKVVDVDAVDVDICGDRGPLVCRADRFEYMALSLTVEA